MTVVMLLPEGSNERQFAQASVCGLPLLVRNLAAAAKAGASRLTVIERSAEDRVLMQRVLDHRLIRGCHITTAYLPSFDPASVSDWERIGESLPSVFLWLPWNLVISRAVLRRLVNAQISTIQPTRLPAADPAFWQQAVVLHRADAPAWLTPGEVYVDLTLTNDESSFLVASPAQIGAAERYLVRNSGKDTDGLYSRMNRRMCWQPVRLLSRTPVTPNAITVLGLLLSALSGYLFAQGHWSAYVLGAVAYFACVLCDEMDGMLARLKFSDSALGCWLETVADYASYMFLFAGLTAGLYRQSGVLWLWVGVLMIVGSGLVMLVLSYQRKMITDPDKPHEFRKKLQHTLERDSSNPISWLGRNLEFMIRKPAYCYWVLIFCILGLTKVFVVLTAFGANAAWMMALSYNRLFQPIRLGKTVLGGQ